MRARAWAKTLANGGQSRGSAAAREEGADGWDLPVTVLQREGEGRSDERDPPVSDRVQRESARSARMGRPAGILAGLSRFRFVFLFPFRFKSALCLILCNKLCTDPKMMKLFV